jgi:SAM-dependent methyltransferase
MPKPEPGSALPSRLAASVAEIAAAHRPPRPWLDGARLPWEEPRFSERMLEVHLDQSTHMASRKLPVIEKHVRWLRGLLRSELPDRPAPLRVLDVGCGPGLYCHLLARAGIQTVGLDCGPASLAYARRLAQEEGLPCRFLEVDLDRPPADLAVQVGAVDAVTFWYGELHSFPPPTAGGILAALAGCLRSAGLFLVEYQPDELFPRNERQEWQACLSSPFSADPHLWLQECRWEESSRAEISVHWIVDATTGRIRRYAQSLQAYSDSELVRMHERAGLLDARFYPPIAGISHRFEFPLLVTRKTAPEAFP